MTAQGVAAQRLLLDRQPTRLGRINAACRAALLLGANRMPGATWPRLDRLRVGRVMGHFQRLQIPLTPQIFSGRAVFRQNASFHMVYA